MSTNGTEARYVALFRGVNVGGRTRVDMAGLRELARELGLAEVRSHLNSGNLVFSHDSGDESALGELLEHGIERRFGINVSCLVREAGYLREVAAGNPFPEAAGHGKLLHASFLSRRLPEERTTTLDPAGFHPERFRLGDRVIYMYLPDGIGRSGLAAALSRPAVLGDTVATTRNWNTVSKLLELVGS
ncbi:Uncharacterized conserved protein, DUF1697 family [Actinopolyspora mzabensis]|uniref:Uncharacterized conserved protein, DUF1697 family n=1 Tax=Actinopolyspora mzabensis TaxID=995066 RepID=A0A1G9AUX3_ACTMZ|nr:DUF1697 domain-containing protein [Actinopolyspora mzabensis]SDK31071.1 Uncharacterized conserved protein, DUF1697 family [Actinopolyspora mzabensis]